MDMDDRAGIDVGVGWEHGCGWGRGEQRGKIGRNVTEEQ